MEKTMDKIVALAKARGFVYLRYTADSQTPGITVTLVLNSRTT